MVLLNNANKPSAPRLRLLVHLMARRVDRYFASLEGLYVLGTVRDLRILKGSELSVPSSQRVLRERERTLRRLEEPCVLRGCFALGRGARNQRVLGRFLRVCALGTLQGLGVLVAEVEQVVQHPVLGIEEVVARRVGVVIDATQERAAAEPRRARRQGAVGRKHATR